MRVMSNSPLVLRSPRALGTLLALLVTFAPLAQAQDLTALLPADTAVALGMRDLAGASERLQPFIEPWVELGVGEALSDALGGANMGDLTGALPETGFDADALPPELEGLDPWALLGREAWVSVSVSPFNPLPALTLVASVDADVAARFDAILARAAAESDAQTLTEGDIDFVVVPAEGFPIAAVRTGDLLALSTNPDVLRGVLRLAAGSDEPSFRDAPEVAATLGALGEGELVGYFDLGPLSRALTPLAAGLGFDRSVERLAALLETLGAYAGVTRLTDDGTATISIRRLDPAGGDAALRDLLSSADAAPRDLLDWVPADALSVQVSAVDAKAWWAYLGDLVEGMTELGVADLDRTIADVLGVDVGNDLFAWTLPGVAVIQTGATEIAPIGAPASDLLGQSVMAVRTSDPAAAEAGLARAFAALTQRATLFADPFAEPGATPQIAVRERDVDGETLFVYDVAPGVTLATAVVDDVALIATSEVGLEAVVRAGRSGRDLPATFDALLDLVPADATAFTLSNDRTIVESSGAQLAQQVQTLAGFAGGDLDFEAVERATSALDAYLDAIAPLFEGSVSWSQSLPDGALEGHERTLIDLR